MSDTPKTVIEDALSCDPSLFISCIPVPPFDRHRISENWRALVNEVKRLQPIEREFADLKAQHAWRPIKTAPKGSGEDGPSNIDHPDYVEPPKILLFTPGGFEVGFYDWYYHKGYGNGADERDSAWCSISGEEINPTHWQPLPEPPKEGAE